MHGVALASLAVAAATLVVATGPAGPARAATAAPVAVIYQPPVDAPVVDEFRPPASGYGPGNRGVDYATTPGSLARAAAAGQVVFAGRVGADLHVVVLHADGIRTSYSFLASLAVRRGQVVEAAQVVGATNGSLHFGARAGDSYLDPMVLLSGADRPLLRLVPDSDRSMQSEAAERGGLRRFLAGASGVAVRVGGAAAEWARDAAGVAASTVRTAAELQAWLSSIGPLATPLWLRVAVAGRAWSDSLATCTPAGMAPPRPAGRRLAVLVGGLNSTSSSAGVDRVDTRSLGYAPDDVVRFSYRGGTITERPYRAVDTHGDLWESGRHLRALLERLHAQDPGVAIDVIAHSQGGLVARAALGARAPPGVSTLVTLATPHQGADLATAAALTASTPNGVLVQELVARTHLTDLDPTARSVRQMAETSPFIRQLSAQALPQGVRITSIAARADVMVASPRAWLAGASNTVVSVPALDQHSELPGSAVATREIALALAGMEPTCQSLVDAVADLVVGEAIAVAEDGAGLALALAGW